MRDRTVAAPVLFAAAILVPPAAAQTPAAPAPCLLAPGIVSTGDIEFGPPPDGPPLRSPANSLGDIYSIGIQALALRPRR
jgi:hypothetical protein